MTEEIRQIVEQTYLEQIGLDPSWTPEQTRVFFDKEAARLSQQVARMASDLQERVIADWTARKGQAPDYMTSVGLINQAKAQAQEMVLTSELYEQIPVPEDFSESEDEEPTEEELMAAARTNPDRWKTLYRSEPSETVVELVAKVWPSRSGLFRIKAEYLLQARTEDLLPVPEGPDSPLAAELALAVEQDLRDDGLLDE